MTTDPAGCTHHKGSQTPNGYGAAWMQGHWIGAHRKAYCLANNVLPNDIKGRVIRHTCDNKLCVNPAHLVIGSTADNAQDQRDRDKQSVKPALTREQAAEIRRLYTPGGTRWNPAPYGQRQLAALFGVAQSVIRQIIINKTYKE